jgi:hypothetical protein
MATLSAIHGGRGANASQQPASGAHQQQPEQRGTEIGTSAQQQVATTGAELPSLPGMRQLPPLRINRAPASGSAANDATPGDGVPAPAAAAPPPAGPQAMHGLQLPRPKHAANTSASAGGGEEPLSPQGSFHSCLSRAPSCQPGGGASGGAACGGINEVDGQRETAARGHPSDAWQERYDELEQLASSYLTPRASLVLAAGAQQGQPGAPEGGPAGPAEGRRGSRAEAAEQGSAAHVPLVEIRLPSGGERRGAGAGKGKKQVLFTTDSLDATALPAGPFCGLFRRGGRARAKHMRGTASKGAKAPAGSAAAGWWHGRAGADAMRS